ncbi:ecdysteroid 22-kinase family protein [Erythrobacter sp. SDW2]|uniref:ecdysteroid 22-kinase family protein n=1 Tax=Erythrobacter sp. SDW2 TaxID=2907154 RepID=UPI001F27EDF9|nr:ecdysteroid 22-kinase family protein [Erythrobacter sp. SDW2]UIP05845.1 ecdysteroid 22-kinase family protein [Erythrobacter sp. SDW2]
MERFPSHPGDVTPEWLTRVLRAEVEGVSWQPIGTGQVGDSARFTLDRHEGSAAPETVAGKFPAADETSRSTAAMFGLYSKEVNFYRDIAAQLAVRVPHVYFSGLAEDGDEFILLFEDLGPCRGGNQIAGCDLSDAEHAIRQAAAIHAPSWHNRAILDAEWLVAKPEVSAQIRALYPQAQAIWRERYADTLEPEFMQLCEAVAEHTVSVFTTEQPVPVSLVHGDFRLDNMLFDINGGAEPIAVLDWQTVTIGNPMTDIGYFLGCGIGDDLRSQHEDRLIDLWLSEMAARGVKLSRGDIWDDYRRGAIHGVTTAVFSAAFVERTERGDANFLSMARGACALALAHDSLGALKGE